jgi:hypothetical protein
MRVHAATRNIRSSELLRSLATETHACLPSNKTVMDVSLLSYLFMVHLTQLPVTQINDSMVSEVAVVEFYVITWHMPGRTEKCNEQLVRHYATSRKVAGSSPDEVDFFFQFTALWPWGRLSL